MKDISKTMNPHVAGVMAAANRASQRALEDAIHTGSGMVVMRDGKLQHISPEQLPKEKSKESKMEDVLFTHDNKFMTAYVVNPDGSQKVLGTLCMDLARNHEARADFVMMIDQALAEQHP